ncbi:hypothetical protein AJ80_09366 [Polytolypa hystricis UAMH7299]|uniref:Uncharacterized protein n=1 Tax=Polytolypa hystricis (strain UAMH7299) TaxID=1447883 RepID=A0A2B7WSB4_POLH7|nr:hypothetical protein AJ80_09366 [Polytolypa hystricis UAMH7299]
MVATEVYEIMLEIHRQAGGQRAIISLGHEQVSRAAWPEVAANGIEPLEKRWRAVICRKWGSLSSVSVAAVIAMKRGSLEKFRLETGVYSRASSFILRQLRQHRVGTYIIMGHSDLRSNVPITNLARVAGIDWLTWAALAAR